MKVTSFESRFNELQDAFLLAKSREYAKWTIPFLMGEASLTGMQHMLEGDFQSKGALLVNSLASKLAGLLFPTTTPFMQIELNSEGKAVVQSVLEEAGEKPESINNFLAVLSSEASAKAFQGKTFFQLTLALKYLIVTGNVAIRRVEEQSAIICYGINSYVTRRDGLGNVVEAILREEQYFGDLPEDVRLSLILSGKYGSNTDNLQDRKVKIYRRITKGDYYYTETLGVDNLILGEEFVTEYEHRKLPYIFPTWTLINGEHYGRGLVEENKGDHAKLSALSESLTLYEAEMMRVVHLVNASDADAIEDLAVADNGEYVRVNAGAITAYESGNAQKAEVVGADIQVVFESLSKAYMWRGNTRDAERVTAYEVRQDILEVEASMGGAYSALAESFQLPLSYLMLFETDPEFMDAILDLDVGQVSITTGINALGKSTKAQQMLQALAEAGSVLEIAQLDQRIDPTKIMDIVFASKGLDFRDISKSDEQLEQEAQARLEQAQGEQQMQEGIAMASMAEQI